MLDIDVTIDVVDIGANPIAVDGRPPYQDLLEAGKVRLVGRGKARMKPIYPMRFMMEPSRP